MSDIFIAYSRTDGAVARRLAERLRAEAWSVFMDVQTHVGRRYDEVIENELDAARAVFVLWSVASRKSHDVLDEARDGRDKGVLFPAFIESVKSPLGFRHTQTADLIGWTGDTEHPGLAHLLGSLREHLAGRGPASRTGDVLHAEGVVTSKPVPPAAARVLTPGQTFCDRLKSGADGPLMVVIPAGRFRMGSPPEEPERLDTEDPQHEVRIAMPLAMGVYAVTFEDYDRFCDDTKRGQPEDEGWGRDGRPVINVSREDAQAYCAWLTEQTGRRYRLPSEAEWEYACRAGTETPFYFGATLTTDQANFDGNYTYNGSAKGEYRKQTVPVGSFPPNAFGLCDMHGNVWEWCQDAWHWSYKGAPTGGSAWEAGGETSRVLRGRSRNNNPRNCRAGYRNNNRPDNRNNNIGFRVCCTAHIVISPGGRHRRRRNFRPTTVCRTRPGCDRWNWGAGPIYDKWMISRCSPAARPLSCLCWFPSAGLETQSVKLPLHVSITRRALPRSSLPARHNSVHLNTANAPAVARAAFGRVLLDIIQRDGRRSHPA